jgi:hypothetical protein
MSAPQPRLSGGGGYDHRHGATSRFALLIVLLMVAAGCLPARQTPGAAAPAPCEDRVELAPAVPPQMQELGATRAVGSGDTWFFAPTVDQWSSSAQPEGQGYQLKIGMWVGSDKPPNVTVREVDGGNAVGTTTFGPTASGLPVPLPSSSHLPTAGCWEIVARGVTGLATARVWVGPAT